MATEATHVRFGDPSYQAYQILHIAFTVAPIIAGLDKFFHVLVNWDQYLAPVVANVLPFDGHTFMLILGAIEIVAGLLVWFKPRLGGYVVAAWLTLIALSLVTGGKFFDVAVRDLVMAVGAFALARLSEVRETAEAPSAAALRTRTA